MKSKWHNEYEVNCALKNIKAGSIETHRDMSKKKIAVIGAGNTGMVSIAMLKEEGLEPVCFEKTSKPGGTWYYREETEDGVPSIMPTTIINHSKEMGAFSNFPPSEHYNNYMRHFELYQYFMEYWNTKDCLRHVKVNMETISVVRAEDYEMSGQWVVTVRSTLTGEITSDIFDGVMVCVGHINRPKMPTYPGQERFKGKIIHSHSLKGVAEYQGQVVAVVGMGCSALDAAVEISHVAKQVYLSTKTGAYIMTRVGPKGYPMDYVLLRRYMTFFLDYLPRDACSKYIEMKYLNPKFDHKMYSVQPSYHMFSKDPVINDHIGSKLLSGSVIQKTDIAHFTEDGILFKGDDHITKIDSVIMATGYTWKFPLLEEGIVLQEDGVINLYKCIFPPQLRHPTLAIMGFILVFGPGFPVSEMQARWVSQVLMGKKTLPSQKVMEKDVRSRYKTNSKKYAPNDKMSIRVDYVQYMDEIAYLIGARPNFWKMFFTDIKLYWRLVWGPALAYQYRLKGPHKWKGARQAILTSKQRLLSPLHRNRDNRNQVHVNLAYSS
ncbi:flavin-containing monooxygenase 5-like [Parasteatoda tepidariorum]|uniref:flavin-containing monooxygenase 5-like n=1 Tax=Parasteatoda tepidariorum TaxID=114398 RepID=UPI001C729675|nr:flavin-containing monooxygenase 5-like [Parasteatoda tepidariorum]XP_042895051.1 flavin-containing monooxygenase 5-like [Parasteatoda tepidariorum]